MPNKYKVNRKVDKEPAEEIDSWKREGIYTHILPLRDLWNGHSKSLMTAFTVPSPSLLPGSPVSPAKPTMSLAWDWFCLLRSFEPALSLKKRAYHFILSWYKPQPVLDQEPSFVKENHPVFRSLHNGMGPQQKWQQESVLKKKIWYKKKLQYFYSQSSAFPPSMSYL